ncbi:GntR family transcriptional regulator [Spirillospora sp. NPDC048832]
MVDLSDPRPLREQITTLILRRIADGTYPVGSKIPTTRQLAQECDVSERTVAEAVKTLREDRPSRHRGPGRLRPPQARRRRVSRV